MNIVHTLILIAMIVAGCVFSGSVLMMSPKGGLGFGVGGAGSNNEYSSKKSFEFVLKRMAIVSLVIFLLCVIIYPYLIQL